MAIVKVAASQVPIRLIILIMITAIIIKRDDGDIFISVIG